SSAALDHDVGDELGSGSRLHGTDSVAPRGGGQRHPPLARQPLEVLALRISLHRHQSRDGPTAAVADRDGFAASHRTQICAQVRAQLADTDHVLGLDHVVTLVLIRDHVKAHDGNPHPSPTEAPPSLWTELSQRSKRSEPSWSASWNASWASSS